MSKQGKEGRSLLFNTRMKGLGPVDKMFDRDRQMKITIISQGDESVGIFGSEATVELDKVFVTENEGMREIVRNILSGAFGELFDGSVEVRFEDECPDCYSTEGHKSGCPSEEAIEGRNET